MDKAEFKPKHTISIDVEPFLGYKCDICQGTGKVKGEDGSIQRCPSCDGLGKRNDPYRDWLD